MLISLKQWECVDDQRYMVLGSSGARDRQQVTKSITLRAAGPGENWNPVISQSSVYIFQHSPGPLEMLFQLPPASRGDEPRSPLITGPSFKICVALLNDNLRLYFSSYYWVRHFKFLFQYTTIKFSNVLYSSRNGLFSTQYVSIISVRFLIE